MNMIECGVLLKECLDETLGKKDIDLILIENQIGSFRAFKNENVTGYDYTIFYSE